MSLLRSTVEKGQKPGIGFGFSLGALMCADQTCAIFWPETGLKKSFFYSFHVQASGMLRGFIAQRPLERSVRFLPFEVDGSVTTYGTDKDPFKSIFSFDWFYLDTETITSAGVGNSKLPSIILEFCRGFTFTSAAVPEYDVQLGCGW